MSGIGPVGALVVVTGAGRGIGAATARRYAEHGARVVCVDIDGEAATAAAAACTRIAKYARALAMPCDVADADAVGALAERVAAEVGKVDVLVNNAGVGAGGPFLDGTVEDWEWLRSVNLDGVVHTCHAFVPAMIARGRGHVVNVASAAGYAASRRAPIYCASKAAVAHLSRALRADWAGAGIGVSVICPGVIDTPIYTDTRAPGMSEREDAFIRATFARGHDPDLVARAIVDAAAHNRDLVSVGWEAHLVYRVLRLTPSPIHELLARL